VTFFWSARKLDIFVENVFVEKKFFSGIKGKEMKMKLKLKMAFDCWKGNWRIEEF
jgi:hypothetical protein